MSRASHSWIGIPLIYDVGGGNLAKSILCNSRFLSGSLRRILFIEEMPGSSLDSNHWRTSLQKSASLVNPCLRISFSIVSKSVSWPWTLTLDQRFLPPLLGLKMYYFLFQHGTKHCCLIPNWSFTAMSSKSCKQVSWVHGFNFKLFSFFTKLRYREPVNVIPKAWINSVVYSRLWFPLKFWRPDTFAVSYIQGVLWYLLWW